MIYIYCKKDYYYFMKIVISEEKYNSDLINYSKDNLFVKITDIPELVKDVLLNYR